MTPLEFYTQAIQQKTLNYDTCQAMAMQHLQTIYTHLVTKKKWLIFRKKIPFKGLYLWGEVGRGKTELMDIFYRQLPIPKLRMHFYQFMQFIHNKLSKQEGIANPLHPIARDLAHRTKIICLDEFLVHEIGDAMLLANLLKALFEHRITLVTTANTPPNALYQTGLQRELFLPAIKLLNQHLTIFHLKTSHDYRTNVTKENTSHDMCYTLSLIEIKQLFKRLSNGAAVHHEPLNIDGRLINHYGYTEAIIWFDFNVLCAVPRSQIDYLNIAKRFSTVLVSGIKTMNEQNDNNVRLFIHLIDIFYDAGIQLILTSETKIDNLYPKGRFLFEFKRTKSRLIAFQNKSISLINKKKGT